MFKDADGNVEPLLNGEDNKKFISAASFPQLHVLTGIVGKIIKELERKIFTSAIQGTEFMNKWMESVNVLRTVYHGSASCVGDMANRLLNNLDSLSSNWTERHAARLFPLLRPSSSSTL